MASDFTPALGRPWLTAYYDAAIRILTRERSWRAQLLRLVAPRAGESIVDVGCGTGTFAIMLKKCAPLARIVGVDPDLQVLAIAREKAESAGVTIEWRRDFARNLGSEGSEFDKAVSSLVFHQVPPAEKEAGISAMLRAVHPGGEVYILDYAAQPGWLMTRLFQIVQRLDGWENTQANADGAIERILAALNGSPVKPKAVIRTPTGALSLFAIRARIARPERGPADAGQCCGAVATTGRNGPLSRRRIGVRGLT